MKPFTILISSILVLFLMGMLSGNYAWSQSKTTATEHVVDFVYFTHLNFSPEDGSITDLSGKRVARVILTAAKKTKYGFANGVMKVSWGEGNRIHDGEDEKDRCSWDGNNGQTRDYDCNGDDFAGVQEVP